MGIKSQLRDINDHGKRYQSLVFVCPACVEFGYEGVHMVPVNTDLVQSWEFDGNLEKPTLSPSLLTKYREGVCHSFLKNGQFQYLADCTHSMALLTVDIPDLPDWIIKEGE